MEQKFGPTGKFPDGSMGPHDEGELQIGVAHDLKGNVLINFGKPVSGIGMLPEQAINFAKLILRHAGIKKIELEL